MKTGLMLATLGLVASLVAQICLWRINETLASRNLSLSRHNAALRSDLKLANQRADELDREALHLDTQLGATKALLSERSRRQAVLVAEIDTLRELAHPPRAASPALHSNPLLEPRRPRRGLGDIEVGPTSEALPAKETILPATPDPMLDYQRRISELENQLTTLLTRALAEPAPPSNPLGPPSPKVVRVGPDDAFVIVDVGLEDGLHPGQTLFLQRGTTRLARVQISDARARHSLAQVLPGTQKGKLQTGDIVLLTP
jgi:hypothetical protein